MAKSFPLPPSHEDYGHPSYDTSNRFELDALLRRHGFEIWERKAAPLWVLRSRPHSQKLHPKIKFSQSEALLRINPDAVKDAMFLEDMDREADLSQLLNEGKTNELSD